MLKPRKRGVYFHNFCKGTSQEKKIKQIVLLTLKASLKDFLLRKTDLRRGAIQGDTSAPAASTETGTTPILSEVRTIMRSETNGFGTQKKVIYITQPGQKWVCSEPSLYRNEIGVTPA